MKMKRHLVAFLLVAGGGLRPCGYVLRDQVIQGEGDKHIIQGSLTRLKAPMRLALDPAHNEIIVPQGDEVMTYPRDGNGNVAPIRVLRGLRAGAGGAAAVDAVHNLLIVAGGGGRGGPRFLIFNRTAQGEEKPLRTIGGPKNRLKGLGGPFAVHAEKGWIVATDDGVGEEMASDQNYMAVWSVEDDGDVPPRWRIGGPKGVFQMPRGVVFGSKAQGSNRERQAPERCTYILDAGTVLRPVR